MRCQCWGFKMDEKTGIAIRPCAPDELSTVLDLLHKAAVWLKSKNIDYWQNWLNPPDTHINWVKQGVENGEFRFAYESENESKIAGMYRLQYLDEDFWGRRDDKAGYIHSFTTHRDFKGNGIGRFILKSIEAELSQNGFDYLRLDCSPDVYGLCEYYENYGFEPREIIFFQGEKLRLYEKKIG